ncbi:hypothetical protein DSO57_1031321 [Entomophthora muscae]|uniref:Uncharacterized protein n=2 Tax=Entomophthora muscae TaxID=34485 RepID=A0ACC2TN30_9FUNG|nr:hypothetical protein DSO57_1029860 [Entomophthora muscae]KAJ9079845.1 hypothetical protein DSO57_1031321 [Entomophthora muscae]
MQFSSIFILVVSGIQAGNITLHRRANDGCKPLTGGMLYDCGSPSDILQIKQVSMTPSRPQAGRALKLRIQGLLRGEVTFGAKVAITGKLRSMRILSVEKDLCRGSRMTKALISCPVKPPTFDFQYNTSIPFLTPRGHYTITATAVSQNNEQIFNTLFEFDL